MFIFVCYKSKHLSSIGKTPKSHKWLKRSATRFMWSKIMLMWSKKILIVSNSVQLKFGLYSISHSPRYSIVLLRLIHLKIICCTIITLWKRAL